MICSVKAFEDDGNVHYLACGQSGRVPQLSTAADCLHEGSALSLT